MRVLRNAGREACAVFRAETPTHRRFRDHRRRSDLAVLAYLFERHAAQTEIETFGSALFWTSTQLLTVSSSIKDPISFGGRVLDVFMEAYAITGDRRSCRAFGAFIQKRGSELDGKG